MTKVGCRVPFGSAQPTHALGGGTGESSAAVSPPGLRL